MSENYVKVVDPKVARKMVGEAVRDFKATEKRKGNLTIRAAYATEAAFASGLVGSHEGAAYPTAETYGKAFTADGRQGVSKTLVTAWRRLGRALVVGLSVESREWNVLANMSGALEPVVGKAIMAVDESGNYVATPESIATAIWSVRGMDGAKIKSGTARPDDGGKGKGDKVAEALAKVAAEKDPLKRAMLAVVAVETATKGVEWSTEDWSKIETALQKIVTREVTLLAKREKAAEKISA